MQYYSTPKYSIMKPSMIPFSCVKKTLRRIVVITTFFLLHICCFAQTEMEGTAGQKVQMADGLRSSGKIYVVVAVLVTILAGLFMYLYRLDKKISKLENKL